MSALSQLSHTDRGILIRLALGQTVKEVSAALRKTPSAIRKRLRRLYRVSGAVNTISLVVIALAHDGISNPFGGEQ